ncbi:hypothetical protein Amet_3906 [Alkaliphilus metalliredigens QYMF]|uniref:Uncharacterized protein n=1 Tax=Alkaliphilus metalliredigens (strain QYMF) TaxID=293826 RepID=A6TUY4_ALKMQ|nr:hypothetical protein [Alkaliphilus metalliredigens]ABR50002.1 hypothetical protein Amet_3906 [Alkaliphilus metalliredigens QYMF]
MTKKTTSVNYIAEEVMDMIRNNKISKFLDQYSNELIRMGIYLLVIAFIFGLSLIYAKW